MRDKGVHAFPKSISLKVNVIACLEHELIYYDFAVLLVSHNVTGIAPIFIFMFLLSFYFFYLYTVLSNTNSFEKNIYVVPSISFQAFFVQVFKIVVNYWKFSMLLLFILWDDWPIFRISGSKEQIQQQLEFTLIVTAGEFQKCNLDFRRTICNKILF